MHEKILDITANMAYALSQLIGQEQDFLSDLDDEDSTCDVVKQYMQLSFYLLKRSGCMDILKKNLPDSIDHDTDLYYHQFQDDVELLMKGNNNYDYF